MRYVFLWLFCVCLLLGFTPCSHSEPVPWSEIDEILQSGEWSVAVQHLRRLRQQEQDLLVQARLAWRLGLAYEARDQWELATQHYEEALAFDGWDKHPEKNIVRSQYAAALSDRGMLPAAVEVLRSAVATIPSGTQTILADMQSNIMLQYGELLLATNQYHEALQVFQQVLEQSSVSYRIPILMYLISAARQAGAPPSQWEWFSEKVLAFPESTGELHYTLASMLQREEVHALALKHYRVVMLQAPHLMRGDRYGIEQYLSQHGVLDEFIEILATQPAHQMTTQHYRLLADMYLASGDPSQAFSLLEQVAQKRPLLWREIAASYQAAGEFILATSAYQRLLANDPEGGHEWDYGALLAKSGQVEQAQQVWSEKLARDSSTQSLITAARMFEQHGFLDEAVEAYEQASKALDNPSAFGVSLMDLHLRREDIPAMVKEYQKISSHNDFFSHQAFGALERSLQFAQMTPGFTDRFRALLIDETYAQEPWLPSAIQLYLEILIAQHAYKQALNFVMTPPMHLKHAGLSDDQQTNWCTQIATKAGNTGALEIAVSAVKAIPTSVAQQQGLLLRMAYWQGVLGDWSDSAKTFLTYQQITSDTSASSLPSAAVQLGLAEAFVRCHSPGEALEVIQSVISNQMPSETGQAKFYFIRGLAYSQLKQLQAASADLSQASAGSVVYRPEINLRLGDMALWDGNFETAERLWQAAWQSGDLADPITTKALQRIRWRQTLSVDHLKQYGLALFFDWSGAWQEAQDAYRLLAAQLGRTDEAARLLHRVAELSVLNGQTETAIREWNQIRKWVEDLVLAATIDYRLAELALDTDDLVSVVLANPQTLGGERARVLLEQLNKEQHP